MGRTEVGRMGWRRDHPDLRDYTVHTEGVKAILDRSVPLRAAKRKTPAVMDLREWCPPVEDQGNLGSCTANAGVGLLEYFEKRAFGRYLDASRLFLYKATRNLQGDGGDSGAYLRTTMKALALFGAPPETHYPYEIGKFDEEPPAFCYAFGQNFKAIQYYRLDPSGTAPGKVLDRVKESIAGKLPCMFGFTVYRSIEESGPEGEIPFPGPKEPVAGGHAVAAVGYDDARRIGKERGALLIRNSWGEGWGDGGYGWLPYAYVATGLAVDFWTLVQAGFVDSELFS